MASLFRDLHHGARSLLRTPGFTLIAVLILGVGIGANTTVFSLANALFLRPLPVADPSTIVRAYSNRHSNTRYRSYLEYRDRNRTLAGLAGFQPRSFGLRVDRETEHAFGEVVTGEYFQVLGVRASHGRLIQPADDRPGAPPVVVLSHTFWTRRFAAAPEILGKTIALNDQPFTVVGVAAEQFTGVLAPLQADLWVPSAADLILRPDIDAATRPDATSLHMIGRLKPGVERAAAGADLDAIGQQLREVAGVRGAGPAATVYGPTVLHPEASTPVVAFVALLGAVVAVVLLIVGVNLANLVLARAAGRDVELAVRQSLGASRARLVRQLVAENMILAAAGASAGWILAFWCTNILMAIQLPAPVPLALDLTLDGRVLAFTGLAAFGAAIVFGMVPAMSASRVDLVYALKGSGPDGPRHSRFRSIFLVAQVSMSVLLLVAAALFVRSFQHALGIHTSFVSDRVLTASVDLDTRGYSAARGRAFAAALHDRLRQAPNVVAANLLDIVPLTLSNRTYLMVREGDPDPPRDQPPPQVYVNAVGPGHFETLQIPILSGRDFTQQDRDDAPDVVIVNDTLARAFWPGRSAIGQRVRPLGDNSGAAFEVVGVVRDSKYVTVGEPSRPFLYRPLAQEYVPRISILVRAAGPPETALPAIKDAVRALDPGMAVFNIATMEDASSLSLLPARIAGTLLAGLGVLALALAALGIYGVLSYLVRARTREIGVRVAIGATPRSVATMVVRQALSWTLVGASIGVAGALVVSRLLEAFLYGVSPTDPWAYLGVTLIISAVACMAALVPALRASRTDPIAALRSL